MLSTFTYDLNVLNGGGGRGSAVQLLPSNPPSPPPLQMLMLVVVVVRGVDTEFGYFRSVSSVSGLISHNAVSNALIDSLIFTSRLATRGRPK